MLPHYNDKMKSNLDRYMAHWIDLWDIEAMTSYNREIGVCGQSGQVGCFSPGVHTHGYSPLNKLKVS